MQKIAVIGAGPAGATCAYQLTRGGRSVEVFERAGRAGGLCSSLELWGQTVDLGPHRFFSADPQVNALWREVVGDDYHTVNRLTRIYYGGKFYYYPLRPVNVVANLGPLQSIACLASYAGALLRGPGAGGDFESWVSARFGKRLYTMFFKTYSEKLWGISCKQLSSDFAAQRIRKLSLFEALRAALPGAKKAQHETLVDHFMYPIGGTGRVYEKMLDTVKTSGGEVRLATSVTSVAQTEQGWWIESGAARSGPFSSVVSSMPVTELIAVLDSVPQRVKEAATKLTYRNTVLVYLKIGSSGLFADQWLYIHSAQLKMGRITNFRNWIPELYGQSADTILCVEYWCNDTDPLWSASDTAWEELAATELATTGLVQPNQVQASHTIRIGRSYPIYAQGYKENLALVRDYLLERKGLRAIGRNGTFKYNNQDDSILMGLLAAREILDGKPQDIWGVNTDKETYREGALYKGGPKKGVE